MCRSSAAITRDRRMISGRVPTIGHDLEPSHAAPRWSRCPGGRRSRISVAQKSTIISPAPTFSMLCVMPGGMSTTLKSVPDTRYSVTSSPRIGRNRMTASPSSTQNFSTLRSW